MERPVRARVLVAEVESLGLTIDDLVAAGGHEPRVSNRVPTVAGYVEVVERAFGPGRTAETYRSYWRLAIARFGDRPIDAVGDDGGERVLADAVARAQQRRRGSDGRSSREHCVSALRALFGRAERAGLIARNPAAILDTPRRLDSRRRALDDAELAEVVEAVRTTSHDPDLDLLLVRLHLESGARRQGALKLRLGDLDSRRSTVWLREKYGKLREQPVSPSLLAALEAHARSRGAVTAEDAVFRTRRCRPIVRRRYNTLFDRAQAALPWTRRTPVTAHVLRHTAGTAVERVAGYAVAQTFLGHAPSSVTGQDAKARIEELRQPWPYSPASHILSPTSSRPLPNQAATTRRPTPDGAPLGRPVGRRQAVGSQQGLPAGRQLATFRARRRGHSRTGDQSIWCTSVAMVILTAGQHSGTVMVSTSASCRGEMTDQAAPARFRLRSEPDRDGLRDRVRIEWPWCCYRRVVADSARPREPARGRLCLSNLAQLL